MATFRIMEEREKENLGEPKRFGTKREGAAAGALKETNNVRQDCKRAKLSQRQENAVPVVKVQGRKNLHSNDAKPGPSKISPLQEDFEQISLATCLQPSTSRELISRREFVDDVPGSALYLGDIRKYLSAMEKTVEWPRANYMSRQPHITRSMRTVLVDWLASVAAEYSLSEQTLHLSVNYIDRFLSHMAVVKEKFQLLGSAAMMLAGKVEDVYPPYSKEWAYLTGNSYTHIQVQKMERVIIRVLRYNLQPPTILTFIQQLCVEHRLDERTMHLAMYISELILLEGDDYLQYMPSKLAAGAVVLARLTLSKRRPWPKTLEATSGYSLMQLSTVVQRQHKTFSDSPKKAQQAIQTKYAADSYGKVAGLSPPRELMFNIDSEE